MRYSESRDCTVEYMAATEILSVMAMFWPTIAVHIRFLAECDSQLPSYTVWAMNMLTAFGLFAVTAMVVCYALEPRHRSFILLFAFSCVLGSAYGFLQGAWPFGLVELVWSGIAAAKWWSGRRPKTHL